jgi:phosphoenolpyruvate carboxykinase (ATP)
VLEQGIRNPAHGAEKIGLGAARMIYWNLLAPELYEFAIAWGEAEIVAGGAICAETGVHTGRSPKDKYIVLDDMTRDTVWWDNNGQMTHDRFQVLLDDFLSHSTDKTLYAQDLLAGADRTHGLRTRVYTEKAWHSLFIRTLLIRPERSELEKFVPDLTILCKPTFNADPKRHGVRTGTVIAIDLSRKIVLIGGSSYAGEIKKAVFTTLNYLLPAHGVMPMHCWANAGPKGDSAVFFGLSGTGKTTLSADPQRTLIGDDEHGWSSTGIFNFEGGCYAKAIKLNADAEPAIYAATQRFGTVLENVVYDPLTRVCDFDDQSKTENTRAAYPLDFIPNSSETGQAGHPRNLIMLTADAFGVMPPIARLTPAQAMFHFLSGYTAKVAGGKA